MSITTKGKVLSGSLPNKQKKLVDAWIILHEDELKATWHAYNEDLPTVPGLNGKMPMVPGLNGKILIKF